MSTVWFVVQKPFTSLWRGIELARWDKLCAALFGLDDAELKWDNHHQGDQLMRNPTEYKDVSGPARAIYGDLAETKKLIPEPILSHRLAHVAISCMQYLHCWDFNTPPTQGHLLAWVVKSKRSPWLWRQRMRATSMRH